MRRLIPLVISLWLVWPTFAMAEVVGKLTQLEGRVELLKGGKLPATAAKAQEGVEPGDVLRTKSLSRAQITFLDNTTVTLSPESRIAIDEYLFDPAKGKRSAVLELFQGLAHLVVTQVFKVQEPDFLVKTHTAVMGVRGTEVGIRLSPNDTTFLNRHGLVRLANIFPEVGDTLKKAEKVAYDFGPAYVDLTDMQGSVVARGLTPTLPFPITEEDWQLFLRQLHEGPQTRGAAFPEGASPGLAANLPEAVSPALVNLMNTIFNNTAITPRLAAAQTTPPPSAIQSFTFSEIFSAGAFSLSFGSFSGSASVTRTVAYPGSFAALFSFTATPGGVFPSVDSGSFTVTANTVKVSGPAAGTLTGTMTMSATAAGSLSTTSFNLSGPVSIAPSGALTFTPTGTFVLSGGTPTGGTVTGSLTQH